MTCADARGFSYVEVLVAMVILAGAVTSMGFALGSSRTVGADNARNATATYLVQDGIAWASGLKRSEPGSPASFGPESGETAATFDDVDDLDGLAQAPPIDCAGTVFDSRWTRTFKVESVDLVDPRVVVTPASTKLMRVRVVVLDAGAEVAAGVAILWRIP